MKFEIWKDTVIDVMSRAPSRRRRRRRPRCRRRCRHRRRRRACRGIKRCRRVISHDRSKDKIRSSCSSVDVRLFLKKDNNIQRLKGHILLVAVSHPALYI